MTHLRGFGKYLFLGFGILLLCGCEAVQDVVLTGSSPEMAAAPLRVTMVYPSDCVGDSAYCDSFHTGVKAAEAALAIVLTEVSAIEGDTAVSKMVLRDAARTSDLVLTAGYQMGEPLAKVAPEFPDVKFAIFDVVLDLPNVASINYRANEGSFLVGAIAALKTESGKIGYIGGADVPLLHGFEAGYIAGVQAINPDAHIFIEYISAGAIGFEQPEKAEALALAQYENGVDVIYAVAGGAGHGVLAAARSQKKYIIWVDSNGNPLAPGVVLTSMVKELSASVERIVQETVDGGFTAGVRYFGLADGGVSYALDEHNRPLFSDDMIATLESLQAQIIAGEIVVPNTLSLPRE